MGKTFDETKASYAQRKFCEENGYPHFAPASGRCYRCGRNIYKQVKNRFTGRTTGISVEEAGSTLITGCPHCDLSYCD